jgi:hypothetical protein
MGVSGEWIVVSQVGCVKRTIWRLERRIHVVRLTFAWAGRETAHNRRYECYTTSLAIHYPLSTIHYPLSTTPPSFLAHFSSAALGREYRGVSFQTSWRFPAS